MPKNSDAAPIVSQDNEHLLLQACFSEEGICDSVLESVPIEAFTTEACKLVYSRIKDLRAMRSEVNNVTVGDSLMAYGQLKNVGGLTFLAGLVSGGITHQTAQSLIRLVMDKYTRRRLSLIGQSLSEAANDLTADTKQILSGLERQIAGVFRSSQKSHPERISDIAGAYSIDNLLDPSRERGKGIYTGYRQLDELTGGIFPGENWICGAATSVGKTGICLQVAKHNAVQGIPVQFQSLEMPKRAIYNRLLCQEAGISVTRFRSGEAQQNPTERQRLLDAHGVLQELPLFIDDSFAVKPAELWSKSRRMWEYNGVRLGILDFIQKMRSDSNDRNEYSRLTEICDSFVGLSKELFPWFITSQLNRESRKAKQEPRKEDLRGAGSIEELGNVIFLVYREELERGKEKDESLKGKALFIVDKVREGKLGRLKMGYIGWRMQYIDPPDESGLL